MKRWGSSVLLELSPPETAKPEAWTAEVPMHLRYLAPAPGGYDNIQVPYPAVFWACAQDEGIKLPANPFDKVNVGYDGLFGPRTVFWHLEPQPESGSRLTSTVTVPVLDTDKAQWVNIGTAATVLLGFAWLVWKLMAVYMRSGHGPGPSQATKAAQQKKRQ